MLLSLDQPKTIAHEMAFTIFTGIALFYSQCSIHCSSKGQLRIGGQVLPQETGEDDFLYRGGPALDEDRK
jgi:hypothetical protein